MDLQTAKELNDLTTDFYARVGESFSATRQHPWKGWNRIRELAHAYGPRLTLLDLACGNLRFEHFLSSEHPRLHAWAIDHDKALAQADGAESFPCVTFVPLDILGTLLSGESLTDALPVPPCDMSVCFGFMHHVAFPQHRAAVLRALVEHTKPGGIVVTSFWQFARSPRILAKAQPLPDVGDYLLGWQDRTDVHRYCHSYADDEIDELVASLNGDVHVVERFQADGKTNNLNCYVVLRKA